MLCPSCNRNHPVSFRCGYCGQELVRRSVSAVSREGSSSPSAVAVALGDSYHNQEAMDRAPVRFSHAQTLAARASRLGAFLIDGIMEIVVLWPLMMSVTIFEPRSQAAESTFFLSFFSMIALGIYQMVLLSRDGQSLGKKAMKIRIVRFDDGGNPGFAEAVGFRLLVNGLIWMVPGYALLDIMYIFSAERRCLHDRIAGTKVVEA